MIIYAIKSTVRERGELYLTFRRGGRGRSVFGLTQELSSAYVGRDHAKVDRIRRQAENTFVHYFVTIEIGSFDKLRTGKC